MRVLVVTSTFPRWASDTEPSFVFELCKYLQSNGMQIDVLAPHCYYASETEVLDGIRVYRYKYFLTRLQTLAYEGGIMAKIKNNPLNYLLVPLFLLGQLFAIIGCLKSDKYDLIHCHWLIPQGLVCVIARIVAGKPATALVCTSHGGDLFSLNNVIFQNMKRFVASRVDQLYVVSNAMKTHAISLGMKAEKISVMPMGVDLINRFKEVDGNQRIKKRVVFVGRLVEKKGVEFLLDAFKKVHAEFSDASLLIIGDGPLRESLELKARNLNVHESVSFLGGKKSEELPYYYSSASIVAVPSVVASSGDQEGLGLVIIEAMGCGCAVVASDLPAIRDIIDEECGVLVAPGDSMQLADKLICLLNNPKRRIEIADAGCEKVRSLFSWEVCGERYLEALNAFQRTEPGN
jgi:glycosyltransferase involved in cell wall biosynthesis